MAVYFLVTFYKHNMVIRSQVYSETSHLYLDVFDYDAIEITMLNEPPTTFEDCELHTADNQPLL